jgi:hypothetical protein
MTTKWANRIVHWTENNTAFISIIFTWDLPKAYSLAVWYREQGYDVKVGGTAVKLMPDYLKEFKTGDIGGMLQKHNPQATRTHLGCVNACSFCGVKLIEPTFEELLIWELLPIVCDNNWTACSWKHLETFGEVMKPVKGIDINQGMDARIFTPRHLEILRGLSLSKLRFAWDNIRDENKIMATLEMVIKSGFPKSKLHVYVLFNHNDTPQDALYRCETLWNMGVVPNPQRYQPLDCLAKNTYIDPNWNNIYLRDFTLYWSRRHLPLETHRVLRLRKLMDFIREGGENGKETEAIYRSGI